MRKKIDNRVRTLIENGIKTRHRSIVVIVGDKGRDQVGHPLIPPCMHRKAILVAQVPSHGVGAVGGHRCAPCDARAVVKARPSVLWCYKTELHFSRYYSLAMGVR
eukprot:1195500-Prorocentrum_minimum.AAC.12